MGEKGIGVNLWFNPFVAPTSSIFDKLKSYTASHTVWNGWIPDYSLPEAYNIFQNHIEEKLLNIGVEGFKIDEVDGPGVTKFPSAGL